MKTKLLLAFLILSGITNAQTWFQQTSGTTKNLWGVTFVNQNLGFVCGDAGTILKTSNGGANWVSQNSGITYQLGGMQFIDANTGYSASWFDDGGKIIKTVNGGTTWNNISLNIANAHSGGIWFFSADTGLLALGNGSFSNSKILKTVNGGVSWDTVYSGGSGWLSFFHFADRNNGYATVSGSKVLKTTDGGTTWTLLNNIGGNLWMSGVYFFNKDTGFVGGGDFNTGGGSIFKTTNGGNTWQTQTSVYGTSIMLFTASVTGYAIGNYASSGWRIKKIIKTTDGGASWVYDPTPSLYSLNGISFPNANNGYAVGDSGVIIKYIGTTDVSNEPTSLPAFFGLSQNYPNPFNPSTTIDFSLPHSSHVTLGVFDLLGKEVARLIDRELSGGTYKVEWNAQPFSSGSYFYRLVAGDYSDTKKLILQK